MLFNKSIVPNLARSFLFIVLASLSLSATANHHEDGEKKAKAKMEKAMEKKGAKHKKMTDEAAAAGHEGMDHSDMTDTEEGLEEEAEDLAPES